jgi:hypothetical protein
VEAGRERQGFDKEEEGGLSAPPNINPAYGPASESWAKPQLAANNLYVF